MVEHVSQQARRDKQASFYSLEETAMEGGGGGVGEEWGRETEGDRVNSLDDCQASVNNPLILE